MFFGVFWFFCFLNYNFPFFFVDFISQLVITVQKLNFSNDFTCAVSAIRAAVLFGPWSINTIFITYPGVVIQDALDFWVVLTVCSSKKNYANTI